MRYSFILVTMLFIPVIALSDTIIVPDDYPTIQGAIDAAVNGDTVLVKPGTYVENIDFLGKSITVTSDLGADMTVIDGNQSDCVVSFVNAEDLDSVLKGFTIRNGHGMYGGGIQCHGSAPTIMNNVITSNTSFFSGGGISCEYGSSPLISNNMVSDNYANTRGGGIYCCDSSPLILANMIVENSGCGVYCEKDGGAIVNCILLGNIAFGAGGIHCTDNSTTSVINNTISRNKALWTGGLLSADFSTIEVVNTIIWDNEADTSAREIMIGEPCGLPSTMNISHSDVKGGQSLVKVNHGCTLVWGAGMIDADPLFVKSTAGDFHLTHPSPCRCSGDNTTVTVPNDYEGDPRIYQGTVDMGADEFYTHLYVTGNKTPGGSIQGKFVGLPGTNPVGLFIGSGILPTPATTMWGEYWLQAPWFLFTLIPIPSDGILELPTTLPGSIPAPYDIPMQALIGLNADSLSNLCVLEVR